MINKQKKKKITGLLNHIILNNLRIKSKFVCGHACFRSDSHWGRDNRCRLIFNSNLDDDFDSYQVFDFFSTDQPNGIEEN